VTKKDLVGVIHGRFQMLHKGHMEYLLAGKKRCEHLIIGIANPDTSLTKYNTANPHRSNPNANPLTYFERFQMLQGTLKDYGIGLDEFDIVPFPINYPELVFNYVPVDAKYYITIYDEWGEEKKKILENIGCDVDVMWRRKPEERFTSGTEVRKRICEGRPWKDLVPEYVYKYTLDHKLDVRICEINK
jgi:cytidyltransferase-related domain